MTLWRAAEHAHTHLIKLFCSFTCALFEKRYFSTSNVFNSNSQQIHISIHISGFAINSIIYFKKPVQNVFLSYAYLHEVHFYKFNLPMFYKVLYVHTCWTRRLAEIELVTISHDFQFKFNCKAHLSTLNSYYSSGLKAWPAISTIKALSFPAFVLYNWHVIFMLYVS